MASIRHVDVRINGLDGQGVLLRDVELSTTGRDVRKRLLGEASLPRKVGARVVLQWKDEILLLEKSLEEQVLDENLLKAGAIDLSYVYVPGSLYGAWRFLQGLPVDDLPLEGLTELEGLQSRNQLRYLPDELVSLHFGNPGGVQIVDGCGSKLAAFRDGYHSKVIFLTVFFVFTHGPRPFSESYWFASATASYLGGMEEPFQTRKPRKPPHEHHQEEEFF